MQWKRGIELLTGVALGLGFFLVILWLLNFVFPDSSGLGVLARSKGAGASNRSLKFDGPDANDVIAELTEVRRNVKDRSASSVVWQRSVAGEGLENRHAVQSRKASGATIAFNETNRLELDEETLLVLRRPNRFSPSRASEGAVLFVDGRLRGRLDGRADAPMDVEIVTAGGSIRAKSGVEVPAEFSVSANKSGTTTLSVHDGAAEIQWGDVTTSVPANHSVAFDLDGAPGRPHLLPERPKLAKPENGQDFIYRSTPPQVEFRWSEIEMADTYRVEIARDVSFRDVVYETFVSEPYFVHGNLHAGRYWWRTSAFSGDAEGRSSRGGKFEVIQDSKSPPLSVLLPEGPLPQGRVTLQGRSEPGCRIVVGDRDISADASGEFVIELDLRAGYNLLVVQAIDPAGNTAFLSREIQARATIPGSSL